MKFTVVPVKYEYFGIIYIYNKKQQPCFQRSKYFMNHVFYLFIKLWMIQSVIERPGAIASI